MINNKRITALIQARVSSARLPMKHFRPIGPRSVIEWILYRLSRIAQIDRIVISTTREQGSQQYDAYHNQFTYEVFQYEGDVNDVVGRHAQAASQYESEYYLVISGDCPLIEEEYIAGLIQQVADKDKLGVFGEASIHEGIQLFSKEGMAFIDRQSLTPDQRENFGYQINYPDGQVSGIKVAPKFLANRCRISVDNMADLRFMNHLHQRCEDQHLAFDLSNVVDIIDAEPHVLYLNRHVRQKEVGHQTKRFVFLTEASPPVGLGHLSRMIGLAQQLNETHHHGVTFLINEDAVAIEKLKREGYLYDYQVYLPETLPQIIKTQQMDMIIVDLADPFPVVPILAKTGKQVLYYDKAVEGASPPATILQGVQPESTPPSVWSGWGTVFINKQLEYRWRTRSAYKRGLYLSFGASDPEGYLLQVVEHLPVGIPVMARVGDYQRDAADLPARVKRFEDAPSVVAIATCELGICAYGVTFYELLFSGAKVIGVARNDHDGKILDQLEAQGFCIRLQDISQLPHLLDRARQLTPFDYRLYLEARDQFVRNLLDLLK